MSDIAHFIGGNIATGTVDRYQPVFNPATGDSNKTVIHATAREVDQAVVAAKAASNNMAENASPTLGAHSEPVQDYSV